SMFVTITPRRLKQAHLRIDVTLPVSDICSGILFHIFVSPLRPTGTRETGKEFEVRSWGASFNDTVDFVRFSGVFPFACCEHINLGTPRFKSAHAASHTKQN